MITKTVHQSTNSGYVRTLSAANTNPPRLPNPSRLWARTPVGVGAAASELEEGDGERLELLASAGPGVVEGGGVLVLLEPGVLVLVLVGEGCGVVVVVVSVLGSSVP